MKLLNLLLMLLTAALAAWCIVLSVTTFQAGDIVWALINAIVAGINVATFVMNAIMVTRS